MRKLVKSRKFVILFFIQVFSVISVAQVIQTQGKNNSIDYERLARTG